MKLTMNRPIRFSQNFLHNPTLVKSLLAKTDITDKDTVYDIGAGKGIIASALAAKCHTVVAVEADPKLVDVLRKNLQGCSNVLVYEGDFLNLPLPQARYKVFANIPFNLNADILHRLVDADNPPTSSYLVVQKEFAQKLITGKKGDKSHNSQLAVLLDVQFKARIVAELSPTDFYPIPKVTSVLLEILKRQAALVPAQDMQLFRNFVVYTYNAFKPSVSEALLPIFNSNEFARVAKDLGFASSSKPTQLYSGQWLGLFSLALKRRQNLERLVHNREELLAKKHATRTKLHRTR
jgi:23S rRNA (adenine-N6)-dimethyltransferase